MKRITRFIVSLAMMGAYGQVHADLTEAEQAQIETIQVTIKAGGKLYVQKSYEDSGKKVRRAQMMYQKLSRTGDEDIMTALEPLKRRLEKARKLLAERGVKLPELKTFTKPTEEPLTDGEGEPLPGEGPGARVPDRGAREEFGPDPDRKTFTRPQARTPAGSRRISFTKQVVPILVGHCAKCHIGESKGEFSMASYAALMKGSPDGPAITPGNLEESTLIALIDAGEMPPKGEAVSQEAVRLLKDWVRQGATFDGKKESVNLMSLLVDPSKLFGFPEDAATDLIPGRERIRETREPRESREEDGEAREAREGGTEDDDSAGTETTSSEESSKEE